MATPAPLRYFESRARVYRHVWRGSVISTFLNPVLYLAAMGLGLGTLVDEGSGREIINNLSYLEYLAPGLLAATAMQTTAGDSSFPVMAGIKWVRSYEATLASPLTIRDLTLGHFSWVLARATFSLAVFVGVMAAFGAVDVVPGVAALGPAILTGMAFGPPITAMTARMQDAQGIAAMFRFGIIPMFLFSGTFFPIEQLPNWLEPVAWLTPLWHGVELTRGVALGIDTTWSPLIHVAYLAAWMIAGTFAAVYFLRKRMVT
ncbi:MAG: ABC transporter permease [Acidimicrobiia bacterium]|nr:ABC transporter permease [Acidimicrobiia bacterium]MDH3471440.1 ABC transporter permease [Acidimicrobiia bacterium]